MSEAQDERKDLVRQFILSFTCLAALLSAWAGFRWGGFSNQVILGFQILAYVSGGWYPMRGVLEDLREFRFNVNFLMVAAAMGAAFIGQHTEGAILMFLFSLSGALENYASGRTRNAIRALMKLSPEEACRIMDGREETVAVSILKVGDVILTRPGERIAADGVILEGVTAVDESSLTGESLPVDRRPGQRVLAGTINQHGTIRFRTDRDVNDTTLAKVFRVVEEAQQQKAPTQRLIEKYGGPYTIAIVMATLGMLLVGLYVKGDPFKASLYRAMTLMVVASPCALVLSIPSAVLASIAAGAWRGILFKGGRAIEIVGQVKVVAFDKTGTLTEGKPQLVETLYADKTSPDEVLTDVASLEGDSEHPLAQVLVQEAKGKGLQVSRSVESKAIPGMGIEGTVRGSLLRVGSEAYICLHGGMEEWVREALVRLRSRGITCIIAARQKALAVFGVADTMRPAAPSILKRLEEMGVKSVMLTGDHSAAAGELARKLGLKEFRAGLLPDQKVDAIKELAREHQMVAMVGDGVNDAPALVTAQVGIAMGATGSDVALENADIVLMGDDLEHVPRIIQMGRRTHAVIRQNLVFALGVMLLLVIGACTDQINLATGVIGHEGSTLLVCFNSLRLLGYRS